MDFLKNISILVSFSSCILGCINSGENNNFSEIVNLDAELNENSGIIVTDSSHLWSLNDSGNASKLYQLDFEGKITEEITIETLQNTDWEAITKDAAGALYIGDFGNNDNLRTDLGIYKIASADLANSTAIPCQKTSFFYPEQTSFPPKKKELLYDCEAFFEKDGYFYLFTKNRSKNFDGTTLLYKIPNQNGRFEAQLLGSFKTGTDYKTGVITDVAISPDAKKIALLGHASIWLLENYIGDAFFDGTITEIPLQHNSQKESISFKNNQILLLADEKAKGEGGKLYQLTLN